MKPCRVRLTKRSQKTVVEHMLKFGGVSVRAADKFIEYAPLPPKRYWPSQA